MQLAAARKGPAGAWHFQLAAMLLGALAYEAYLNYIGETIAPEEWANGEKCLRDKGYKGTYGKLRRLLEINNIPEPDKDLRPFSSIHGLMKLRNEIVHARLHIDTFDVKHSVHAPNPAVKRWLQSRVSHEKAETALKDLKAYLEDVHAVFRQKHGSNLARRALNGSVGVGSYWTSSDSE